MRLRSLARLYCGGLQNFFREQFQPSPSILYVSEAKDWAIRAVGKDLLKSMEQFVSFSMAISPFFSRARVFHFGSEYVIPGHYTEGQYRAQKLCASIYHLPLEDRRTQDVAKLHRLLDVFHTACSITASQLLAHGVPSEKIIRLPLGVDLSLYVVKNDAIRSLIRKRIGIPASAFVIGSFQKDGVGWGEGLEPKFIKGPDLFVKALAISRYRKQLHVLLTGPARGYVKKNLEKLGVAYTHVGYVKNKKDLASLYQALDLYIITSRVEGAPLSLCEAWASGIPTVSTRVGMVFDHATDRETVLFSDFDPEDIARAIDQAIESEELRRTLVVNAKRKVTEFDWKLLNSAYYENLYRPLLS